MNYKLSYLAIVLLLLSCKKEQPVINEVAADPCVNTKYVGADFLIEEMTSTFPNLSNYTDTDTIFYNKSVRFTALEENAKYTWYIGSEVLNDKQVIRYFDQSLSYTTQTISLVVKKKPNKLCLPDDDGYDSVSKPLYISHLPIWNSPDAIVGPLEGDFRVKSTHLVDSFDVHIDVTYIGGNVYFNIDNYDGIGSSCTQQAIIRGLNYRQLFGFDGVSVNQCDYILGDVHLRMDGLVEMNFSFGTNNPSSPEYVKRKYLGRKL